MPVQSAQYCWSLGMHPTTRRVRAMTLLYIGVSRHKNKAEQRVEFCIMGRIQELRIKIKQQTKLGCGESYNL